MILLGGKGLALRFVVLSRPFFIFPSSLLLSLSVLYLFIVQPAGWLLFVLFSFNVVGFHLLEKKHNIQ